MQNQSKTTFLPDSLRFGENLPQQSFLNLWERRVSIADKNVNSSVSEFANNLWHNLTKELLDNFDNYRKDPDCSWLTDSDIWLKSIEDVYHKNPQKMPWELEKYMLNMLNLLISYKSAKGNLVTLSQVMKSEIQIKDLSNITLKLDWQELPPFNSRIRPADGVTPLNA